MRDQMTRLAAAAAVVFAFSSDAIAQPYPAKPIRFIVPFAPGGSADILARTLSQRMSEPLGQAIVIENRGGAGGGIGADLAAKAPPDGYVVLFTTNGPVTVTPSLQQKVTYDALKDFTPITIIAALPNMLVTHPSLPVQSVKDLVALAKASPGQITYASGGAGASNHLAAELLKYMAGIDLVHVPYKGGGPAAIAAVTGEVSLLFATLPSAIGHVKTQRLRAIAVTSDKRSPAMPNVPTIAESGVPGYEMTSWVGALVPASTPAAIVSKLHQELAKAVQLQDVGERLRSEGYEIVMSTPEQMTQRMRAETAKWAKVIKAARITSE